MPELMTLHETAALLRKSSDRFRRDWRVMIAEQGFPQPVNERGQWLWCRIHLDAWLDRKLPELLRQAVKEMRGTPEPLKLTIVGESPEVIAAADALDQQYS